MGVKVAKDAIDLGIVTTNGPAMLAFYRDVLGFVHAAIEPDEFIARYGQQKGSSF